MTHGVAKNMQVQHAHHVNPVKHKKKRLVALTVVEERVDKMTTTRS